MRKLVVGLFLFLAMALPAHAFVYEGDGTHELLGTSNEIRLDNGLVILTNFSGDFSKIGFYVYGESKMTNYNTPLLGTTPYLSQGQTETFNYAKGSFRVTIVSVVPDEWETRSTIVVSSDTTTSFAVTSLTHGLNTRNGSIHNEWFQFTTSIPVKPEMVFCEGAASCLASVKGLANSGGFNSNHSVAVDLEPATAYKYKIVGVSADGFTFEDTNGGAWYSFTTPASPSLALATEVKAYSDSAEIYWKKDGDYYFTVEYGIGSVTEMSTLDVKQIIMLDGSLNHYVTLRGLTPGTTYKYRISRRAPGGDYAQTQERTFATHSSAIEFWGEVEYVSPRSVTLSWSTDTECQGGIVIESAPTARLEMLSRITEFHSGRVLDLQPQTKYRYRLSCKTTGNVTAEYPYNTSEWLDFTTTAETATPPTTPAPAPSGPSADKDTVLNRERSRFVAKDVQLTRNVRGKILLQVEEKGEAWYVNPADDSRYYLGRANDAFQIMRKAGLGISNADLGKIPVGTKVVYDGQDSDQDRLPDSMEEALGTDAFKADTDGDGFDDLTEFSTGYNPRGGGRLSADAGLTQRLRGQILLQVEGKGQAWYVNPDDGLRYYLGTPADAYNVMRRLSLGITNQNLNKIEIAN